MTNQLPWVQGLMAGTCLIITACSGTSGASTAIATAPMPWVCDTRYNSGQCRDIVVQSALPMRHEEVHHLARKSKFVITYDGTHYGVQLKSKDWLPGFLRAGPLEWVEGVETRKYDNCTAAFVPKTAPGTKPKYSSFVSKKIPIHLDDSYTGIEEHTWYIYPLTDTPAGKIAYCLSFTDQSPNGGTHDGAVHGEVN